MITFPALLKSRSDGTLVTNEKLFALDLSRAQVAFQSCITPFSLTHCQNVIEFASVLKTNLQEAWKLDPFFAGSSSFSCTVSSCSLVSGISNAKSSSFTSSIILRFCSSSRKATDCIMDQGRLPHSGFSKQLHSGNGLAGHS